MKLVKPNVELLTQSPGIQGIYDAIAQAAATCYKSEAKTGEGAKDFVAKLAKSGHLAMLEFGTVYLTIPFESYETTFDEDACPYSHCMGTKVHLEDKNYYITTNLRVLYENGWIDDLECLVDPTEHHSMRLTARFNISIGIGREFTRHRVFSFAQESTRYCNYGKNKFDNQVTFVIPSWAESIKERVYQAPLKAYEALDKDYIFGYACYMAESFYKDMLELGATPQQAREVLPLTTKSELCMCGFEEDWTHFFNLRLRETTGKAHPDAKYIAGKLHDLFEKEGIIL